MTDRAGIVVDRKTKERFERFQRVNAEELHGEYGKTSHDATLRKLLDFWENNHEESK